MKDRALKCASVCHAGHITSLLVEAAAPLVNLIGLATSLKH